MKISTLEEYSIRCLAQLSRATGKLTISQIAEAEGLTEENTAKVMARLRTHGLVRSIRGKDGGYLLARPAEEISVADVVASVSGAVLDWERCHGNDPGDGCVHRTDCGLRPVWTNLTRIVDTFLGSISLADLVDDEQAVASRLRELRGSRPASAAGAAPANTRSAPEGPAGAPPLGEVAAPGASSGERA